MSMTARLITTHHVPTKLVSFTDFPSGKTVTRTVFNKDVVDPDEVYVVVLKALAFKEALEKSEVRMEDPFSLE